MKPSFASNPVRTRADVQQLVRDLAEPLVANFSPGRAQIRLGENRAAYGDPAGWLEGFARPFWGLVPLAAGGGAFKHWALWQQGITNGVNPSHPEYWGLPGDVDQRSVEQAAFGFALSLTPEKVWEPLSAAAREQLTTWLQRINEVKLVQSNWLWFRVLVNLGLRRCGQPWSQERITSDLAQIDQFYLGDGWYSDGPSGPPFRDGRTGDYYCPMAFHLYGLIYARGASDHDPAGAARYVERSRLFARDFMYWFSGDGSALPFGRSLTYRFAQGAFWGGLAYAAVEALPWPVIKGLYLRHLRWWLTQPIFSDTGLLTIGYAYPNLLMQESYNSAGSPYWAMKAFLPLALPETHPFWRAEEAPLPPRRAVQTIPNAKLILCTDPKTRETLAVNPGQPVYDWPRNAPHKYSKCAYSTHFGFNVPAGSTAAWEAGADNTISVSEDNRLFRVREHCEDADVCNGVAYSTWKPWPDVTLRSWLLAVEDGSHLRIHQLTTARKIWTLDGGYPLGFEDGKTVKTMPDSPAGAIASTPHGTSAMRDLMGGRKSECLALGPNSSLLHSLTVMPLLRDAHEPGEHWLAGWVGAVAASQANLDGPSAHFTVTIDAAGIRVTRDGASWWSWTPHDHLCGTSSPERLEQLSQKV